MVLRFLGTLISKIFYLHHSHFRTWFFSPLPLEVVLFINRYIINYGNLCLHIVNYSVICGNSDHKNPWYCKGLLFVCSGSRFGTGALDLQRFENVSKKALLTWSLLVLPLNETSIRIYEYTHENTNRKKGIIQDLSIDLSHAYPFWFLKTDFFQFKHMVFPKHTHHSF